MAIFGLQTKKEVQRAIENALKAEQIKWPKWLLDTARSEEWNLPDPSIYENQADLFRVLSYVMTAVDITSSTAALSAFSVSKVFGEQEPKDIPNHPFEMLLQKPNELDSRYEFLYATIALWMLNGNAYWWLNRKSVYDPPSEMWVIPPHLIEPIPDGKMFIDGYDYTVPSGETIIHLENHEIVHFRRFNPFSRFRGLSAVESIAMTSRGDISMQEWNNKFFTEKGGSPAGIFLFEQMIADDQWDKIKADKRAASRNRDDMMLRGVGSGGVKWQQSAITQKDMEFLEGRKFNRSEIFTALAPGLEAKLDPSATEANANAGDRTFKAETVWPKHVLMAEKITASILPAYGDNLRGAFEDIRITDRQLELQERAADEKIMKIVELRKEYKGLEPLGDERDELLIAQVTAKAEPQPIEPEQKPETVQGGEVMEETDEAEADNNALKTELQKWQRKAVKKVGRDVPFDSDLIPANIRHTIESALPACKTESDIRNLFAKAFITTSISAPAYKSEIEMLAQALNNVANKLPTG